MRVPLPWLGDYVSVPAEATAEQVAADLVRVGLEEEAIHGGDVTGPVVVGRVLDFVEEPQRNGKTIRWCTVDVGEYGVEGQPRGIVCGAHNFGVGDAVVVVLPGAVLPGGFAVTARRTYGHVSDGMICSARELGLGDEHDGILRLADLGLGDTPVGADAVALLGLAEQTVEVNVTPDRGYALSVRGVAREYAHSTGRPFTDPAAVDVPKPSDDAFPVRLDDAAPIRGRTGCDRYVARVVRGVDPAAPSPRWLRRRIEQAGMRPISLAVDVTNYVMLAVGQPLHAFDLDALRGAIVVRRARAGERLTTLDGVDRALDPEDLLITDDDGARVLALAGVLGGAGSEVSPITHDLLIEAAHFDPITVARTARRHQLATEASRRFERGVDTDLADRAAELAVRLLVEYGGGMAPAVAPEVGPVTDVDERVEVPPILMAADLPSRVVGVPYSREQVVATLEQIGCTVTTALVGDHAVAAHSTGANGERAGRHRAAGDEPGHGAAAPAVLSVSAPSWRPDLRAGVDLVEEVARLRGYDAIGSVLPIAPAGRGLTHGQRARRSVARAMAGHGLVEVLSYPFVSPSVHDAFGLDGDDPRRRALRLANPLSDEQPELRTSLLPPLLETLRRNVGRGSTDIGIFEIGLVTRPVRLDAVAPRLAVGVRPTDAELAALEAAVPAQPRRLAVALTGQRQLPGWYGPGRAADWTDAIHAALTVAGALGLELGVAPDEHAPWHPGRCARLDLDGVLVGHAGELHPAVVSALGLPARTCVAEVDVDVLIAASGGIRRAVPVSVFPVAKDDVALVVDEGVPAAAVEAALREGAGDLLESLRLFDVYTGAQVPEGKKSIAFALRLRAPDRTLTAQETATARAAAVRVATERTGATLR